MNIKARIEKIVQYKSIRNMPECFLRSNIRYWRKNILGVAPNTTKDLINTWNGELARRGLKEE